MRLLRRSSARRASRRLRLPRYVNALRALASQLTCFSQVDAIIESMDHQSAVRRLHELTSNRLDRQLRLLKAQLIMMKVNDAYRCSARRRAVR